MYKIVYEILKRGSYYMMKVDTEKCIGCGQCVKLLIIICIILEINMNNDNKVIPFDRKSRSK